SSACDAPARNEKFVKQCSSAYCMLPNVMIRMYTIKRPSSPFAPRKDVFVRRAKDEKRRDRRFIVLGECFDPKGEVSIYEHCRPHWSQAGAVVFITFRTHDSIPREVLERWEQEKREWVRLRARDPGQHWSRIIPTLSDRDRADFHKTFHRCREVFLDS